MTVRVRGLAALEESTGHFAPPMQSIAKDCRSAVMAGTTLLEPLKATAESLHAWLTDYVALMLHVVLKRFGVHSNTTGYGRAQPKPVIVI
jgi:hypothetical protein